MKIYFSVGKKYKHFEILQRVLPFRHQSLPLKKKKSFICWDTDKQINKQTSSMESENQAQAQVAPPGYRSLFPTSEGYYGPDGLTLKKSIVAHVPSPKAQKSTNSTTTVPQPQQNDYHEFLEYLSKLHIYFMKCKDYYLALVYEMNRLSMLLEAQVSPNANPILIAEYQHCEMLFIQYRMVIKQLQQRAQQRAPPLQCEAQPMQQQPPPPPPLPLQMPQQMQGGQYVLSQMYDTTQVPSQIL